jgi:hypothetical protein
METPPYWPTPEDQAICARFLQEFPDMGYGLCYLFGMYRGAGFSREEAERRARKGFVTEKGHPCESA